MAENELYSAYHWSKKAEKAAEKAKEIRDSLDAIDISQCLRRNGEEVFQDGTLTIKGDNHPLVIEGMEGTTATGLQIKDSLGAGETDLEHYATGDRYGSRLVNRTSTGAEGTLDLYTTTAGVSVLDATDLSSFLVPTPDTSDSTNRAASTEFVANALQTKVDVNGGNFTAGAKEIIVGWGMPDYSAGVSVSVNQILSGYTSPCDGILYTSAGWLTIKINGYNLPSCNNFKFSNDIVSLQQINFKLCKGDTIVGTGGYVNDSAVFFPYKGVQNA